ncbi:MAG: hypothetical protein IT293_11905 [Deltaproteobacteria bacterium]|nr:hypothetical protein [Deltaproteobacteria bacterium]
MRSNARVVVAGVALLFALVQPAAADITSVARCQKKLATAGADFAKRVIVETLKCTEEVAECQVQCDEGVFGPSCDDGSPPCCDSDDRGSNAAFNDCMTAADAFCAEREQKIAGYETTKQNKIVAACIDLSQDELCGAQGNGLNFALVNAGCLALDAGYTCNLLNLMNCLGGPLQRQLIDQISGLLSPRASDAARVANLQSAFPDLPVTYKLREDLPAAGKVDLWSITGQAGDKVIVRVKTRDDTGSGQSTLEPTVILFGSDQTTPVADTLVNSVPCSVPNTCGTSCPQFQRTLPFSGTFYVAVRANGGNGCGGGKYRFIVTTPGGAAPTLVADDVTP